MSRNSERLGAQQPDVNPPPVTNSENESGGFAFVVPTEFVELPSKGRFYPEGHPLHNQDSIEIRQMTAKEEDLLTSRTLLKKGVALDRVISNLIVDRKINPDSLLVGDRNAIIVATRVSGYGSLYETKVSCPACATTQHNAFDLKNAEVYDGTDLDSVGVVTNDNNTFDVVLPKSNVTVTFRLLTGRDEKTLLNGAEQDRKRKAPERNITRQILNIATAVNGESTKEAIMYLVENIPSIDSRHLRLAYRAANPNIDLTQYFECEECGHDQEMEVPLTADFFWPDR